MELCEKCLYRKNCQYLARHKSSNISGCTVFRSEADFKNEIAREIFTTIKSGIDSLEYNVKTPRKTVKVAELKEQVNWVLHEVIPKTLVEIENEYTDVADTNVRNN